MMKKYVAIIFTAAVLLLVLSSSAFSFGGTKFETTLTGAAEVPPVASSTFGRAEFFVNAAQTKMDYELRILNGDGILGAAGAHIHCGGPNENGPVVMFLAGVVPGGLDGNMEIEATLTGDNIINDACGATLPELVQSMKDGETYVNVHSIANPAGEVRGQIMED